MRFSILVLLLIPFFMNAETETNAFFCFDQIDSLPTDSTAFPNSWSGVWTGTLEINNAKGLAQSLPMELHILPIKDSESYTWWIIYGEDKVAGKRAYELKTVDKEKGIYVVDEHNTIKLESYLIGNKLISYYSVQGTVIIVTNEKVGEEMIFEILAGSDVPVSITGGQKHEGEDIPKVKTYPINVQQKAILKRM